MLRFAVVVLALSGCTKSATPQEGGSRQPPGESPGTLGKVAVPGGDPVEGQAMPLTETRMGRKGDGTAEYATGGAPGGVPVKGGDDSMFRLKPDEGTLTIEAPADAKAGTETIAKLIVTPGAKYKVNLEFPTKLTLETTSGVTFAKAELKAGGASKAKGDADHFDEKQLMFAVKLTASQSGSYTVNGSFRFAVCDKDQCLAKKEPIAIRVAAK
jgi:hypothetical protein